MTIASVIRYKYFFSSFSHTNLVLQKLNDDALKSNHLLTEHVKEK